MRRRSRRDDVTAFASRPHAAVASLEPACHRPGERDLDEQDEPDRAENRRRESAQQPPRVAVTEPKRW